MPTHKRMNQIQALELVRELQHELGEFDVLKGVIQLRADKAAVEKALHQALRSTEIAMGLYQEWTKAPWWCRLFWRQTKLAKRVEPFVEAHAQSEVGGYSAVPEEVTT